jgi:hypothetical protein
VVPGLQRRPCELGQHVRAQLIHGPRVGRIHGASCIGGGIEHHPQRCDIFGRGIQVQPGHSVAIRSVIDPTVLTCPLVPLFRGARRDRGHCAGDRVAVLS